MGAGRLPQRALVLGLARQGRAAAAALRRRGVEVVEADRTLGNDSDPAVLDGVELLLKSGGVPNEAPLAAAALERGIPIWSDAELGYRILPNPLAAVTGTNGKTTTTALLGAIADAPAAGNIGRALCALDGEVPEDAWIACELSSFQLEHVHEFRPRVAVLLNLEPDHLDRHGSFEAYRAAKLRVFENQTPEDVAVVPRGFEPVPGRARRVEFSGDDDLPAEPGIPGAHNRENAAAAVAAARAMGVDEDAIARGLREFPGVPHRLETVAEIDGVIYVNDSKATNVAAARRAVASFGEPIHLILGGYDKGEDYAAFVRELPANVVDCWLIGATADVFSAALEEAGRTRHACGDLATAVASASERARPGEVVLLAPACASYDQYRDFEERGEEFRRLVRTMEA